MYIYSAKTNAFHPIELKQCYIDAGSWPNDGVEISDENYKSFLNVPAGKRWAAGSDGYPKLVDVSPPTLEQLQQRAEREQQRLMNIAREKIEPLLDAVSLNIATNAEKSALTEWRRYRVLLNRVDCSTVPNIAWPEVPK
ncbi:tail fiber assembly protein [Photorhabdus antumapuensis]|uniref:tail fiber assembly protein n=1 Tax=Photorhabdus antumapuensis TaxID=2862867 RepID=UPI001CED6965|nr:tail fiber assembly protein [Photorhabdus antumapuensis]MCA6222971.1 tail fiber assembly protein [Photorhabdus antumapuensis]